MRAERERGLERAGFGIQRGVVRERRGVESKEVRQYDKKVVLVVPTAGKKCWDRERKRK